MLRLDSLTRPKPLAQIERLATARPADCSPKNRTAQSARQDLNAPALITGLRTPAPRSIVFVRRICLKIGYSSAEPEQAMTPDARFRQTPGADPEPLFSAPGFGAPYAPPDEEIAAPLLAQAARPAAAEARIDRLATSLIEAIRRRTGGLGGIEDFLHAYSLSTKEGLALMVLAEALLRVPDTATADLLIEGKLATGDGA